MTVEGQVINRFDELDELTDQFDEAISDPVAATIEGTPAAFIEYIQKLAEQITAKTKELTPADYEAAYTEEGDEDGEEEETD